MIKYFLLLMVLIVSPAYAVPQVLVRGPGIDPCSDLIKQEWWSKDNESDKEVSPVAAYVLGYMSAVVNDKIPDVLPNGTNRDLVMLVFLQCKAQPEMSLYHAIGVVADRLVGAQMPGKEELRGDKPSSELKNDKKQGDYAHHSLKPGEERF